MRTLLIIDPQNDFVDPRGSLYVKDSEKAVANIVKLLSERGNEIDCVCVSKDSHHRLNIGFKEFWENAPEEFQKITARDLMSGKYVPKYFKDSEHIQMMVKHLDDTGQDITIWPTHCIEDTWGCDIADELRVALSKWEMCSQSTYKTITKGRHPFYEAYSIMDADNFYSFEQKLLVDELIVCGFCTDVCVRYSLIDLLADIRDDVLRDRRSIAPKITFLPGCSCAIGDNDEASKYLFEKISQYDDVVRKHLESA